MQVRPALQVVWFAAFATWITLAAPELRAAEPPPAPTLNPAAPRPSASSAAAATQRQPAATPAAAASSQPAAEGSRPELVVAPARLSFPLQSATEPGATQTLELSNNGSKTLKVNSIAVTGDYVVRAPELPQSIQPGMVLVLQVSRTPARLPREGSITILSDADPNPLAVPISAPCGNGIDEILGGCTRDFLFALAMCGAYWLAMVVVRWNRVASSTRSDLRGELKAVETELGTLVVTAKAAPSGTGAPPPATVDAIAQAVGGLLADARAQLDPPDASRTARLADILFWSRGQEMTGWGYAHEAQTRMTPLLDPATVQVRLEAAESRLRQAGDGCSLDLAHLIQLELAKPLPTSPERRQSLLAQALAVTYQSDDNKFSDLVSWQNKASWLVGCGLGAILSVTALMCETAVLCLVGAVGGLISRLSRSLHREDVPTDYGASWTTLFLSPVAGAIGAWAGVMACGLATKLNVLGPLIKVDWQHPADVMTLGLALIFGFSERLLDEVLGKIEGKAVGDVAQSTLAVVKMDLAPGNHDQTYPPQTLQVTGAAGNVTWALAQGEVLPPGLGLSAGGLISGTPTTAGTYPFNVVATDGKSKAVGTFSIKIV